MTQSEWKIPDRGREELSQQTVWPAWVVALSTPHDHRCIEFGDTSTVPITFKTCEEETMSPAITHTFHTHGAPCMCQCHPVALTVSIINPHFIVFLHHQPERAGWVAKRSEWLHFYCILGDPPVTKCGVCVRFNCREASMTVTHHPILRTTLHEQRWCSQRSTRCTAPT